jgi:hypothetical protein
MVTRLFKFLLLFAPIAVASRQSPDMLDLIVFRLGVMSMFIASLFDVPRRSISLPVKKVFLGLFGVCLVSMFAHHFVPVVMHNILNIWFFILGSCILFSYQNEEDLSKLILIAAGLNLAYFIFQQFGKDFIFVTPGYAGESGGFMGNKTRLVTYFSLVVPFLASPLLILPMLVGIFAKQYIIFIPVVITLLWRARNNVVRISIMLLFFTLVIIFWRHIAYSLSYRFNICWFPALLSLSNSFLVGVGPGKNPNNLDFLMNSYLMFFLGFGLVGAVWLGWMIKEYRRYLTLTAVCLMAVMTVEYALELPKLWFLIMTIIVGFLRNIKEGNHVGSEQRA